MPTFTLRYFLIALNQSRENVVALGLRKNGFGELNQLFFDDVNVFKLNIFERITLKNTVFGSDCQVLEVRFAFIVVVKLGGNERKMRGRERNLRRLIRLFQNAVFKEGFFQIGNDGRLFFMVEMRTFDG